MLDYDVSPCTSPPRAPTWTTSCWWSAATSWTTSTRRPTCCLSWGPGYAATRGYSGSWSPSDPGLHPACPTPNLLSRPHHPIQPTTYLKIYNRQLKNRIAVDFSRHSSNPSRAPRCYRNTFSMKIKLVKFLLDIRRLHIRIFRLNNQMWTIKLRETSQMLLSSDSVKVQVHSRGQLFSFSKIEIFPSERRQRDSRITCNTNQDKIIKRRIKVRHEEKMFIFYIAEDISPSRYLHSLSSLSLPMFSDKIKRKRTMTNWIIDDNFLCSFFLFFKI